MWPWAHVAVAYLVLTAVDWSRRDEPPTGVATIAVSLGALAPDLIDKPLAWRLELLPFGRTLAHSLLLAGTALIVLGVVARRYGDSGTVAAFGAFALGYLIHLATDAYQPALLGNWEDLFFLVWPLAAAPESAETTSVIAQLRQLDPTPFFLFEMALTVVAIALWWHHGPPGISTVWGWLPGPKRR